MHAQHQFYLDRAEEARLGVMGSTLENVRARWLRAEASWNEMAQRRASSDILHAKLQAEKAEERAALSS